MQRFEFKSTLAVDDAGAITGTAWPFGAGPDRSGDTIERGAFITPTNLPMLFGHDPREPIGVWDSIKEDANGLTVTGRLLIDDVARAREVRALVQAGAISGLSIGYRTLKATARPKGGRNITSLELVEVSLVTVPMHPGARVTGAKSGSVDPIAHAIHRAARLILSKGNVLNVPH